MVFSENVKRIDPLRVTFAQFFSEFLLLGQPCVISSDLSDSWQCRRDWVANKRINTEFLRDNFGGSQVPVVKCSDEYGVGQVEQWQFQRYLDYLHRTDSSKECFYLKDWHFMKSFAEYHPYKLPSYFQPDWLNEFCDSKNDPVELDFRFVYMGKKGTWTPFHADVLRSYSWSTNVIGRKLWYLCAPGKELELVDNRNQLLTDVRKFWNKQTSEGQYLVEQEPGETIFIPSGWHHQVHNLEDTISVNHNWLNVTNLSYVRKYIMSSLQDVEKEIQDCKDMDNWAQQCQVILKANSGMDLPEYGRLLCLIALNRLSFRNETALKTLKPLSESKQLLEETGRLMIADCICQNCWEMCNSCSSWLNSCDILAIKNELEFLQQSQYHQLLDSELIIHTLKDLNEVF